MNMSGERQHERMVRGEKRKKVTLGGCRKRDRERLAGASFRAVGSRPKALGQGNRFINQRKASPRLGGAPGLTTRRRERETVRVRFPRPSDLILGQLTGLFQGPL